MLKKTVTVNLSQLWVFVSHSPAGKRDMKTIPEYITGHVKGAMERRETVFRVGVTTKNLQWVLGNERAFCKTLREETWKCHILRSERASPEQHTTIMSQRVKNTVTNAPSTCPCFFLFSLRICRSNSTPHLDNHQNFQLRLEKSQVNLNYNSRFGKVALLLSYCFLGSRENDGVWLPCHLLPVQSIKPLWDLTKMCYCCHFTTHITFCCFCSSG